MPRVRRQLQLLRWGSVVAPVLLLLLFAWASWARLEDGARQETARRSELLSEYMRRIVDGQAMLLASAEWAHDLLALAPNSEFIVHRFLAGLTGETGGEGISLVAADGRVLTSSGGYPAAGQFGDPAFIAGASRQDLLVDRVRLREDGPETLAIARRDQGAPPSGIWVAGLDVAPIEDFLRGLAAVSSGDSASVWRMDGRVLLRNIPMPEPLTIDPNGVAMQKMSGGASFATYETVSSVDGVHRIYSTRRMQGVPLFVSFGVSTAGLGAVWLRQVLVAGTLLGACGAVGFAMARHAGRALAVEGARAAHDFDRKLLAEARKTAAMRETMLRELNHRINNNLQMIQSLIRLQKSREAGPDLDEISVRILAIARIHDLLYQSGSSVLVDFAALLRSVADNPALVPPERRIAVACRLDPAEVDAALATPLALCVTELITNAVKHAFGPEGGTITLTLRRLRESAAAEAAFAEITVADDGRGLPAASARRSGSRLVEALVKQIRGRLEIMPHRPESARPGALARIVFPLLPPDP